jgi:hypothetical protein
VEGEIGGTDGGCVEGQHSVGDAAGKSARCHFGDCPGLVGSVGVGGGCRVGDFGEGY